VSEKVDKGRAVVRTIITSRVPQNGLISELRQYKSQNEYSPLSSFCVYIINSQTDHVTELEVPSLHS
jgi:hypothetical protein